MSQLFSESQLNILRGNYSKIKLVDPDSPTVNKLRDYVNGLPVDVLIQLRGARVPWLSALASVRLIQLKAEGKA